MKMNLSTHWMAYRTAVVFVLLVQLLLLNGSVVQPVDVERAADPPGESQTGITDLPQTLQYAISRDLGRDQPTYHFSLQPDLPRIRLRTNGYALGRTLRGHFKADRIGEGMLFVEVGHPPYLFVRTRESYLLLNFLDPGRTRAIHAELLDRQTQSRSGPVPISARITLLVLTTR